ncbi:MAG: hypothetical protein ICV68_16970 [Pyrinomonadaceae bacterium]|nr:hypothetical protein [Pyrinomonadaceae bacterium]
MSLSAKEAALHVGLTKPGLLKAIKQGKLSATKDHRTIEEYFTTLQCAGFRVEQLREAHPHREQFAALETYERRKRIPLFLVLAGRKPISMQ